MHQRLTNRRLFLPALAWFLVTLATVLLALFQETHLKRLLPFLHPESAISAVHGLFLCYIVFILPLSLPDLVRRNLHHPLGPVRFLPVALMAPLLLLLLDLPLFLAMGFFAGQNLSQSLCLAAAWTGPLAAILAFFRLGFYFEWRMLRIYAVAAVAITAGIPLLDLSLEVLYSRGVGGFLSINPFHFLASHLGNEATGFGEAFWSFTALWIGAAAVFSFLPLAVGKPSFGAYEIMTTRKHEAR